MSNWIDINEIPPPIYDTVIVRLGTEGGPEADAAIFNEYGDPTTFNDWELGTTITHWMPMPYTDI